MEVANEPVAVFKLIIMGDGGVGKTTFVKRHRTGEFQKAYVPTKGVDVCNMDFSTSHGKIRFQVWDTAGQEKFGELREVYYIDVKCAIIMFDLTSRQTYKNVAMWHKNLTKIADNIPIVLVGNKADIRERKVKAHQITLQRKHNLQYYDVSAKSNYQYEKPFIWLLKKLSGDDNLFLTEAPLLKDPEFLMDKDHLEHLRQEEEKAQKVGAMNLPDDDEEF